MPREKSNCCGKSEHKECDDKECFVLYGPKTTALFQGFQDVYIRPQAAALSNLHTAGRCLSLVLDDTKHVVEGVRINNDGLYNVSVSAFLESFESNDATDRSGIVALEDVRVFIDDSKFEFPVAPNGQTLQVSAPLFGNQQIQNPSVTYSANLYLERDQQLNFGFLYTSPQSTNYFRLTLEWSVVKLAKQDCQRLHRVYSGRVTNMPA